MAVLTTTQRLENLQTTIQEIETNGQSFSLTGHSMTRADLGALYKQENRLMAQYSTETNGRGQNFVRFKQPK